MKALTLIGLVMVIVSVCVVCSGNNAGTSSEYITNGINSALATR